MKSLSKLLLKGLPALALMASTAASAEVLLNEGFNYPAGDLYGQGGWLQSNNKTNPIQVTSDILAHEGYASGNSVRLKPNDSQDQDCQKPFVADNGDGTYTGITDGPVYVAMLVNVQNVTDQIYFTAFGTTNSSNTIKDGVSFTGPYGATFVVPSSTEGKYTLGIGKNTSSPSATSSKELDYNTTNLVVLKYTAIPGTTNDTFEAWINPVAGIAEPTPELSATVNQGDPTRGIASFALCQATGSVKKSPEMLVGPIRIATSWSELWGDSGSEAPDGKASLAGTVSFGDCYALYQYQKFTAKLSISAKNLTEDVTISGTDIAKPSVTTVSAADAMNGFTVDLEVDASAGTAISETVTLTSGDVSSDVKVEINVFPANTLASFRFIPTMAEYETYYFTGTATVTHVDTANSKIYLQDVVGGMALGYEYTNLDKSPFKVGDKLTKLYIMATEPSFGVPGCELLSYFESDGAAYGTVTETGVTKEPQEVSLSDLSADLESYLNRLVKISDVSFGAAGQKFSTTGTDITSGGATGKVRAFADTDISGTEIPETASSITGISTSPTTVMVTMRSLADLAMTTAGEETLEVSEELLVDANEYYPVGVSTPFAKFTVKAQNLAKAAAIYITGTNRDQFEADLEEIPAGTGVYEITVSLNPTKTGRLVGNLMIDTSNTLLTYNKSFAGLAYDPDHLPEFSVDASAVTDFSAKVGESQEQTITISAQGLLDYGSVRVLGEGNGAFIIGSTMFLKDGTTQLKVTFAPKTEGTFSETIEFSTPKAATQTVKVKGSTNGGAAGSDKEGDELTFDVSNPLTYYPTDFCGSGDKNKPLQIAGWKNVAIDGDRAWWSFTDSDDNQCAKVTSYVWGGATENEPSAEMLLLSPALDYKNCTSRLLSFRIKGELLSDGQYGTLSVLYIDPELDETERYQVILGGTDIPTGSDASGEWAEYVIDLEGLDLADTFFIGFHYLSATGANSPESYYVDDFCYGSTTQPFIRVDKQQAVGFAKVGESADIETVTVTGLNLTEPIAVSLEGKYKDYFSGPAELPAAGGELTFKYTPAEEGEHAVYVVLSSAGAPVSQFIAGGYADGVSGIALPGVENASRIAAYDLNGREVVAERDAAEAISAVRSLEKGVYILRVTSTDGTSKSVKYLRP